MRTILVVDDEFGVVEVLTSALEDEGFRVSSAANGRYALDRLKEITPDVIVLDYMMPVMDAPALINVLRADPNFKRIPIILTSAIDEETVRKRVTEYQAYLRKPFRITQLLEVLRRVLIKSVDSEN